MMPVAVPSAVACALFAAFWPASTVTGPATTIVASGPIEALSPAAEVISASEAPPAPPPTREIAAIFASEVARFAVRDRTVKLDALVTSPSKWAVVPPPTSAVGIMTETERPIEPDLPCAVALAWFAEVANTWIGAPGTDIVVVSPTTAPVEASDPISACEEAPAPERAPMKMFAVAVRFVRGGRLNSTAVGSTSVLNWASVPPLTSAFGRLIEIAPSRPPEAASEIDVAVFVGGSR